MRCGARSRRQGWAAAQRAAAGDARPLLFCASPCFRAASLLSGCCSGHVQPYCSNSRKPPALARRKQAPRRPAKNSSAQRDAAGAPASAAAPLPPPPARAGRQPAASQCVRLFSLAHFLWAAVASQPAGMLATRTVTQSSGPLALLRFMLRPRGDPFNRHAPADAGWSRCSCSRHMRPAPLSFCRGVLVLQG